MGYIPASTAAPVYLRSQSSGGVYPRLKSLKPITPLSGYYSKTLSLLHYTCLQNTYCHRYFYNQQAWTPMLHEEKI